MSHSAPYWQQLSVPQDRSPPAVPSGAVVRDFPHGRRSDADLVADVAAGQEEALVAVWHRHGPRVRRTLLAQLGSDDVVDDLLQEIFWAFAKNAARVSQPERLRSYLLAAAVRQARQEMRNRSRRRRWLGLLAEERKKDRVRPNVHGRDALRRLRDILQEMPARLRETFILRFVEELPLVELAEVRGVSIATAKRDIARAQQRVLLQAERDPALTDYLRGSLSAVSRSQNGSIEESRVPEGGRAQGAGESGWVPVGGSDSPGSSSSWNASSREPEQSRVAPSSQDEAVGDRDRAGSKS